MRFDAVVRLGCVLALLLSSVFAQAVGPLRPELYVCDSTGDLILHLVDLNLDGDFDDALESSVFYSDLVGSLAITNNVACAVGPDGTLYVADSSLKRVLALKDLDGDGNAHGALEHVVWFDGNAGGNAAGLILGAALGLQVDALGVLWLISSQNATGIDGIYRLQDLGGTRGANDLGEAVIWHDRSLAVVGASLPTAVVVAADGSVLFTENSNSGLTPRGIYRAADALIVNGNANDPGEVQPYFLPPAPFQLGSHYGLALDASGVLYATDHNSDIIWRLQDLNNDQVITPGTPEATIFWQATSPSLIWSIAIGEDGALYAAESLNPDQILRLADDIVIDGRANAPGEVLSVLSPQAQGVLPANARALCVRKSPLLGLSAAPRIGTTFLLFEDYESERDLQVWWSTGQASVVVPPIGRLALSFGPQDAFGPLVVDTFGPTPIKTQVLSLPADPSLVGFTLSLQALMGRGQSYRLSNLLIVTIQP